MAFLDGQEENGIPPAATVGNDVFQNIDLTLFPFFGGGYNFGELLPTSLSGYVYVDANNNGLREGNEPGIAGVTVRLTGTDDRGSAVNVTVVTDVNGSFSFQRMRPGTYTLTEVQPTSFIDGLDSTGVGVTAVGAAGNDVISGIVLAANQNGTAFRFGERGLLPELISKRLFLTTASSALSNGSVGTGVAVVTPLNVNQVIRADSAVNNAPTLVSISPQSITDPALVIPFSAVTLSDPNPGRVLTVTITYPGANGTFSNLGGFTGSAGSYSFSGTAAAAQAAFQQLVFNPTANQVAAGFTVSTPVVIAVSDGVGGLVLGQVTIVTTPGRDRLVVLSDTITTFAWTAGTKVAHYDIWVNDLTTGQSQVLRNANASGTSWAAQAALTPGHSYRWWVGTVRGDGTSTWNEALDFTVSPPIPILTSPSGTITSDTPAFTWTPVPGAARYDLWVDDVSTGQGQALRNANVAGTTYTPTAAQALTPGHSYRWWVAAVSTNGTATWSGAQTFALAALASPTLTAPAGTTASLLPTFTWTAVGLARNYDLWVDDVTTGQSQVLRNTNVTATSWTATAALTRGHRYRWWVRALSANGTASKWSDFIDFSIL